MQPKLEFLILKLRSAIANKEMEVAAANRENALGGWLSDHQAAIREINEEIASLRSQIDFLPKD